MTNKQTSQRFSLCFTAQCTPGYGVHVMYKMFNELPPKMIVMGGGCSRVSQPTAESSHYWNVVQVSRDFCAGANKGRSLSAATFCCRYTVPKL